LENKIKTALTQAIRKIHRNYDQVSKTVEKAARVAPATFLSATGCWIYSGKKTPDKLDLDVPEGVELVFEKHKIDHIRPINGVDGFQDWNQFINGTFCNEENYQILSDSEHKIKTKVEAKLRAAFRKCIKEEKDPQEIIDRWESHVDFYKNL